MINKSEFINYSGGAPGADSKWDSIGRTFGFNNHIHYRPEDYVRAAFAIQQLIQEAVEAAAEVLKRPTYFDSINLVRRNWFQINNSAGVFAISRIINPNEFDKGKYKNKTGKQIVSGGTGWTVEMAIQREIPVYVFDMLTNGWYYWDESKFSLLQQAPILTIRYTGIGSTSITKIGENAISSVYAQTINQQIIV